MTQKDSSGYLYTQPFCFDLPEKWCEQLAIEFPTPEEVFLICAHIDYDHSTYRSSSVLTSDKVIPTFAIYKSKGEKTGLILHPETGELWACTRRIIGITNYSGKDTNTTVLTSDIRPDPDTKVYTILGRPLNMHEITQFPSDLVVQALQSQQVINLQTYA